MNLIELCIQRPVGVAVGVIFVVLFGLLALFAIPVQLTPDVDVPVVKVETVWAGANPQEIESEIVDRQEEQLRSVKGLKRIKSSARDNSATVELEFYPEVSKSDALRDVADKLRQVPSYPLEVDEPTIAAVDSNVDNPMAWLILYPTNDKKLNVRELRDFAEDFIQPYLDRVPGVASTSIYGGLEREVQIRVHAARLAARGLTLRDVEQALRNQNQDVSAGTRALGKRNYAIRTTGEFTSLDEIQNTVIAQSGGGPVYMRDVADVVSSFKKADGFVRSKGEFVLAFPVRREVGTNVIQVMADLKLAIRQVNSEVLQARKLDLELVQVYDETEYITQAIEMVRSNILWGGALVLGLLLAFLRSWRATAVLALTIPVSVVGTFLVIVLLGRTLNVISLAGIAFAVGDVVDSAYVVLENIYRHRQLGKPIHQAVLDGTREVWGPVFVSTLTTAAVFVPVIFVQEEAGQLFRDISVAEVAAVGLSMIVALTVIPPLAARLLQRDRVVRFPVEDQRLDDSEATGRSRSVSRDPVLRFAGWVAGLVDFFNRRPAPRIALIGGMTLGSLVLARLLVPDATYLPAGNRNLVFGFLLTPPGYSINEFERMGYEIEQVVAPYWTAQPGSAEHAELDRAWRQRVEGVIAANQIPELSNPALGSLERSRLLREWRTPPPLIDNFFYVSFGGGCFMGCSSRDPARVKPMVRLLETAGGRIPGAIPVFFQTQLFSFGGGNSAEVQVRGDNLEQVTEAAGALMVECMKRFGFPRPDPANFNLGRPELRVIPDRERAAEVGLTAGDVGFLVEACGEGAFVGEFRPGGGDTIDIALYFEGQSDRPTRDIAAIPILTASGTVVPLGSVAQLVETAALEQINHVERQRAVTLEVTPPESLALENVIHAIRDEITPALREQKRIAPDVLVALTGNADKLVDARNSLVGEWEGFTLQSAANIFGGKFFLSVIIVYLLMCALYESWLYPFVIMFSVPLAIFGGFLGLSAARWGTLLTTEQPVQQLDVLTFLGFVMLVGLVVKNAILLVEQALVHLREHNLPIRVAVREAVRVRVRPVLMTSLTSVFGLLPMAFMPGSGTELYRGLAAVILGGMIVSTLGTFVLVPCVLSAVLELRRAASRAATPQPALLTREP